MKVKVQFSAIMKFLTVYSGYICLCTSFYFAV